jgi:hypothetical protein
MKPTLNKRSPGGNCLKETFTSTRAVVESAIAAAKAGNKETWEQVSESSQESKWEEEDACATDKDAVAALRHRAE